MVKQVLDILIAPVVGVGADGVIASSIALLGHVDAVTRAVRIVVPLLLDGVIVGANVVRVAGVDGVVVERWILDEWVVPSIANQDVLEINLVRSRDVLCILLEDVLYSILALSELKNIIHSAYH